MSTSKHISSSVALIAIALALPVAAEEQITPQLQEHAAFQPVSAKRVMPVRAGEAPQRSVIEATLPAMPKHEPMPNPDNMPYITYEGAENSAQ